MFTDKVKPVIYNGVATIYVKNIITKRVGTVICYWTGD